MTGKYIDAFIKNPVVANLLMWLMIISGLLAVRGIPKEVFPEFSLDIVTVGVPYPGASPDEVEEGICRKLENALEGVEGISKLTSSAVEGMGTAVVEVDPKYDTYKVKQDISDEVDRVTDFPLDAEEPVVKEVVNRKSAVLMALAGNAPERTLKELSIDIKQELLRYPSISQVNVVGIRDYEISIEVSEASLRKYGTTFDQVVRAVKRASFNLPGGKIRTRGEEIAIRVKGQRYTGEEFRNIPVLSGRDGSIIRLYQLARIKDGFEEDERYARFDGQPAVRIAVYKTPAEDIIKISRQVRKYIEKKNRRLPGELRLKIWDDRSQRVRERFDLLVKNGTFGLTLVFFILWFFMDVRLSFWVAAGIPVSFAGALWFMNLSGQSLNMISMFGLVMAVGMIVDDAIVIGENVFVKISRGMSPWQAAVSGTAEVALPVVASTTTTLAAFYPLFLVEGIMGKFIRVMPTAVIACLVASLIEAIIILPVHLRHMKLKRHESSLPWWKRYPRKIREAVNKGSNFVTERIYGPVYRLALEYRPVVIALALAVLMLALGLYRGGHINFILMPKFEEETIVSRVAFPYGTSSSVTIGAVGMMEKAAEKLNRRYRQKNGAGIVLRMMSMIGGWSGWDGEKGPHAGEVTLKLCPSAERDVSSERVKATWRELTGDIKGVETLTFDSPRHGPGGKPVELLFQGKEYEKIKGAVKETKELLAAYPGIFDIQDNFRSGKKELLVSLKPEGATLGLTLRDLAEQLRNGYYGAEALKVQRGTEEVKVMVRYPVRERSNLKQLSRIRIRTPSGAQVPFDRVAAVKFSVGYSRIMRENNRRGISVTADLDESKGNARKIIMDLKKGKLEELLSRYPGVTARFEGQHEESKKSIGSLVNGFVLAMFLIYGILAVSFKSYFQPAIIMFSIPFGIVGAILGHWVMGMDISLMSLFGMVALSGIVVNDALVMVDFINKGLAGGKNLSESVRSAGLNRFRAVLLTTVTTVGGLLPLLLETSLQAQFLIPMAVSLSFGLMFATAITLFIVPSLYVILNDIKRGAHWFIFGDFPEPETVESYAKKDYER
ncbi:MAG: efflux RND transporter permease subunit [bacterium]